MFHFYFGCGSSTWVFGSCLVLRASTLWLLLAAFGYTPFCILFMFLDNLEYFKGLQTLGLSWAVSNETRPTLAMAILVHFCILSSCSYIV